MEINYEKMRIRLDLMFRILAQLNLASNIEGFAPDTKLSLRDYEDVKNIVATLGLNLIWINRRDDTVILSREESINAKAMSQFIADEFITLGEKIKKEVVAIPAMKATRYEMLLRAGIDDIIEKIKKLVNG